MKKMIPLFIFCVFAAAAITIAVFWGSEAIENAGYEHIYEQIADEAVAYAPLKVDQPLKPMGTAKQETISEATGNGDTTSEHENRTETTEQYSVEGNELAGAIDFGKLLTQNADTVGWLYIPDTKVNYPVVQTDNNETYLNLSFQGKKAACGTLFLDYRNTYEDRNQIIYGHNMGSSGSLMFSSLLKYKRAAYAKEHPVFRYSTPEGSGEYRVIAVCHLDIRTLETFNFLTQDFATDDSFLDYVELLCNLSLYPIEMPIDATSRLITLITCDRSIYGEHGRLIVVGMLERML